MSRDLKNTIVEVFNEPGCATNQAKGSKERKKGCSKPLTPGAAAGGCAFDGAKIALQPITDVVHLVHGPLACEGNGWDNRHAATSGPKLYRMGFTTDLCELDIVMGNGEKRLYRSLKEIVRDYAPPAIFVYSTCVTALIGDDIESVCRYASEKLETPCIPVNAPGFVGSKNLGNKLAGETLLEYVIGSYEPETTYPHEVNLLGEYNLSGELWQVKPLLEELGIHLHACITGDARYHEVASAHRARVNMMVCSKALINLARKMQERWGIPYFEGSFYGIEDTSTALRTLARLLVERGGESTLIERTEALIRREERRAWERIDPYRADLRGKKVLLYTGGVKSWSVVSALQEIGMEVVGTSVRKSTKEDKERVKELMGGDAQMVEAISAKDMYAQLVSRKIDILLSGGRTQFTALKARTPWVDINQERHNAYAGYDGMVELVKQLHGSLMNPVWEHVRSQAPWEKPAPDQNEDPVLEPIAAE